MSGKKNDYDVLLKRAENAIQFRDFEIAEQILRKLISGQPTLTEPRILLGTAFLRNNQLTDALNTFSKVLELDAKNTKALEGLGVVYLRLGKNHDAFSAFEQAIEYDQTDPELFFGLGNVHKALKDYKKAEMAYAKVLELNPRHVMAYNNLGTTYMLTDETQKAVQIFKKGLATDPNYPSFHLNLGLIYEKSKDYQAALKEFELAVKARPGWIEAMLHYGSCRMELSDYKKALEVFNQILTIEPLNAAARNSIGQIYANLGKLDESLKWFRKALEVDPSYIKSAANIQYLLEKSGKPIEALGEIKALVELIPENVPLHLFYIKSLRLKGKIDEAFEEIRKLVKKDGKNIPVLQEYVVILVELKDFKQVKTVLKNLLTLDTENVEWPLQYSDLCIKNNDIAHAEDIINKSLEKFPAHKQLLLNLARVYNAQEKLEEAKKILLGLVARDENFAEAWYELSNLYQKMGKTDEAVQAAERVMSLAHTLENSEIVDHLYKSLATYENAVASFSDGMKTEWEKNITKLKNAMSTSEEEKENKANKEYEELLALLRSEYIPVEESDELLVLDEREEVLDTDEPLVEIEEEEEEQQSFEGQLLGGMEKETGAGLSSPQEPAQRRAPEPVLDSGSASPARSPEPAQQELRFPQQYPQQQPPVQPQQPMMPPQFPQYPQYPQYPQQAPIIMMSPQQGGSQYAEKSSSREESNNEQHREPYPPEPIDLSQPEYEEPLEDDSDLELLPEDLLDVPLDTDESDAFENMLEGDEDLEYIDETAAPLEDATEQIPETMQEELELPETLADEELEALAGKERNELDQHQDIPEMPDTLQEIPDEIPDFIEEMGEANTEEDIGDGADIGVEYSEEDLPVFKEVPDVEVEEEHEDIFGNDNEAEEGQDETVQEFEQQEAEGQKEIVHNDDGVTKTDNEPRIVAPKEDTQQGELSRSETGRSFSLISDEVEKLFIYLKSLTNSLPEEKKHALNESGVAQKLDMLIQNIEVYKKVNTPETDTVHGVEVSNRLAKLIDRMREEKNSGK